MAHCGAAGRKAHPAANRQGTCALEPTSALTHVPPFTCDQRGQVVSFRSAAHGSSGSLQELPAAQPSVPSANGPCSSDTPAVGRQLQTSRDLGSQCRQLKNQPSGEVGVISPVLGSPPVREGPKPLRLLRSPPWFKNSPGPALSSQASHPGWPWVS